MALDIQSNNKSREIIPIKHNLFDETDPNGVRTIGKIISWEQFQNIPKGIGGRVAVIPWYMANVISRNGAKQPQAMVRLCVSNYLYLSDFGGGFKKTMDPYSGLEKEMEEEVPLWKDYIMYRLPQKGNLFIVMEQYNINPHKSQPIPIQILIFLKVSVDILNELGFKPTPEIRAIADYTLLHFHRRVDETPLIGNMGIRMYHLVRQKEGVHRYMDMYFRSKKVSDTEFYEDNLTNEKVDVLLSNGETTLPFSELVKNNSEFSKKTEEAWHKRRTYAKRRLAWRRPVSNSVSNQKENNGFTRVYHSKSMKHHKNSYKNTRKR